MISNYTYPQHRLFQFLADIQAASTQILHPLVIAPQYLLSRFGKETDVPSFAYAAASAAQVVPWKYNNGTADVTIPGTHEPDLGFTRLYGEGLEATLATLLNGGDRAFTVKSALKTNTLVLSYGSANVKGSSLATELTGREVAVGDLAYVTTGGKTYRRTVTGLRGRVVAAVFGTDAESDDTLAKGSDYNPATLGTSATACTVAPTGMDTGTVLTVNNPNDFKGTKQGALYLNGLGDEFTLTVTTGGAVATAAVAVTSKSGLYSGSITSTNSSGDFLFTDGSTDGDIMGGLAVKLESTVTGASLVAGQVFKFTIKSLYTRLSTTNTTGMVTVDLKSGVTAPQSARDTTYVVEVTTGTYNATNSTSTGAVVRITDTAGIDATESVTLTDDTAFDLGTSGLEMKFATEDGGSPLPQGGLRKGDIYFVHVIAEHESATVFNQVVLDGPAVDSTTFTDFTVKVDVEFRLAYTGRILADAAADDSAWSAGSSGVTVQAGLSLFVSGRTSGSEWCPFVNSVGTLSLYFRALVPPVADEDKVAITTTSDITDNFGTIDIDNDAAYGAFEMLRGAGGLITCYLLRVAGIEVADFTTALKKVENTKLVYALAAMSTNFDVGLAVATHCSAMSGASKKRFRRSYWGTDSPGSYALLQTIDNDPINCTVGDYSGENILLTATTDGVDFTVLDLDAGDIIKLPVTEVSYEIAEVLSATEILLASGPALPISPAVQFEVWKADTAASQAAFVRGRSRALNNRRAANVWTENGKREIDGVKTIVPNRYQAAHIAGLRCAMLPQQGLTRTQVGSISEAPSMFLRYSSELLDEIAADGTWIINQDAESGSIYIRHQLTTASGAGALAYEDSIGVIVDSISFKIDSIVDKYIGKRNVTTQTLIDLRNELADMLNAETQTDYGEDAGPALIRFEKLMIVPDPILKDRVKIKMRLIVPLPFNLGDTYIDVDQDANLATIVA